ncbi:hypothetical protein SteCoe_18802 [Stentor coeruleus]|uniref:RRM domain-containing protein n=1 Tax=Stentor coeruleus TaxID=5963 RepID=A0A1R2BVJ7_9CILI|nr:hypothetical protein SteCoe_18802 [Stentor coeruleus]
MEEVESIKLVDRNMKQRGTLSALKFEDYALPPDIDKAKEFREAHMIRVEVDGELHEASICKTKLSQLGEYGIGLQLYFLSIKQIGIMFLFMSFISIWPMYENYLGNGLPDGVKRQDWDSLTLANQYTYDYTLSETQAENQLHSYKNSKIRLLIADILYSMIFIFSVISMHMVSREKIQSNSQKNVTAADYAVEVTGFPCENFKPEEVTELFSQFGDIVEVRFAYKYNGILKNYKQRADLLMELRYLERLNLTGANVEYKLATVKKEIKRFDEEIKTRQANMAKSHDELPVIKAFIIFARLSDRLNCLTNYKHASISLSRYPNQLKFRNTFKLTVLPTSEPSNINWENLEYTSCKRLLRQFLAIFLACIVFISTIIVVYLMRSFDDGLPSNIKCIKTYQVDKNVSLNIAKILYTTDDMKYCYCSLQSLKEILADTSLTNYCGYFLKKRSYGITIRFFVSCGVIMINFFLKLVFRGLSRFERVDSKSKEQVKIMVRVFIAVFINTSLIVLAVNANFSSVGFFDKLPFGKYIFNSMFSDFTREWYVQVGSTLTITMIVSVFSPQIGNLLIFYPKGACKRVCCRRYKTQREINIAFTGPDFDIATRYSQILNVVFSSMLYSGGIPLLNVTCCATMLVLYWIDKILVLRHYSKPPRFSQELNDKFLAILPLSAALHSAFSLYMLGSEDIFPEHFYTQDGYLYSYKNTIYDRVVSISGIICLGIIIVSICAYIYISSSNWYFSCNFKKKNYSKVHAENLEGEKTFYDELENIKQHGLHTYNILSNQIYHDLIVSMKESIHEMVPGIVKPRSNSKDYLVECNTEN